MIYFRKVWMSALVLAFVCRVGCQAVLSIVNELMAFASRWFPIKNSELYFTWNKKISTNILIIADKSIIVIQILIAIIICVFIFDLLSGQLYRDYKSKQLVKFLLREVPSQNLNLVVMEEENANRWIKKLRIVKWRGKMLLIIPCIGSGAVVSVIKKRCDTSLPEWLYGNFKGTSWTPLTVKSGGSISWLTTKEK